MVLELGGVIPKVGDGWRIWEGIGKPAVWRISKMAQNRQIPTTLLQLACKLFRIQFFSNYYYYMTY
jgi:hypothetical protein